MGKTVYVLGAGFSMSAGLPPQAAILSKVFENNLNGLDETEVLLRTESEFMTARIRIARFLLKLFSGTSEQVIFPNFKGYRDNDYKDKPSDALTLFTFIKNNLCNVTLEDVFTIIDKAIITGETIHGYNTGDLYKLRESLSLCILRIFTEETLKHSFEVESYIKFTRHLLNIRQKGIDPIALITLNWDSILDTYLNNEINKIGIKAGIDYCIYDYDYECCLTDKEYLPSTHLKRMGFLNIKLLKLHGGLNWLICTNCHRLFYSYKDNIGLKQFFQEPDFAICPFCSKSYSDLDGNIAFIKLQCNLGTPTMLKNLDDVNLKNIWKNAFVELTEAEKVVFIGYSFPYADYEFRYTLKRALNPQAKIEVILAQNDNPKKYDFIRNKKLKTKIIDALPTRRYDSFFGEGRVLYNYNGFEGFISQLNEE